MIDSQGIKIKSGTPLVRPPAVDGGWGQIELVILQFPTSVGGDAQLYLADSCMITLGAWPGRCRCRQRLGTLRAAVIVKIRSREIC
jgi:hypothetical protein